MTTPRQFLSRQPFGPSQHRNFALADRIKLYRRVIGFLRLSIKPTLTYREGLELRTAVSEAMLITGSFVDDAQKQIAMLTPLLEECVNKQAAIDLGFINA